MTNVSSYLKATAFVSPGFETDPGEWTNDIRADIAALREHYPELSHWGDLAIGSAFGRFSRDVLEVSWAEWMLAARDDIFLDYCCWVQTRGKWALGLDKDLLATANEWKQNITVKISKTKRSAQQNRDLT